LGEEQWSNKRMLLGKWGGGWYTRGACRGEHNQNGAAKAWTEKQWAIKHERIKKDQTGEKGDPVEWCRRSHRIVHIFCSLAGEMGRCWGGWQIPGGGESPNGEEGHVFFKNVTRGRGPQGVNGHDQHEDAKPESKRSPGRSGSY